MTALNKPYTHNVIINLGGNPEQVEALQERILEKNQRTTVTVLNPRNLKDGPSQIERELLAKVDDMSRIYIIDHCHPNANHLGQWHYSVISEYLAEAIQRENLNLHDSNLRISLIACNSADGGKGGVESVASKLHYSLARLGIISEVVARTRFVTIHDQMSVIEGKYTVGMGEKLKIDLLGKCGLLSHSDPIQLIRNHHHVPGSKADFIWNRKGEQVRVDSYIRALVKKTERVLNAFQQEEITSLKEIQRLKELVEDEEIFDKASIKEVISLLEQLKAQTEEREECSAKPIKDFRLALAQLLHDAKKSISSYSLDTEVLDITLPQNDFYKSIQQSVYQDFIFPFEQISRSFPEFPQKEEWIQKLSSISIRLARTVVWKLEHNLSITQEREFTTKLLSLLTRIQSGIVDKKGIDTILQEVTHIYRNESTLDKVSNYSKGVITGLQRVWSIGLHGVPFLGSSLEFGRENLTIANSLTENLEGMRDGLYNLVGGAESVEDRENDPVIEEPAEEENLALINGGENQPRGPVIEEV